MVSIRSPVVRYLQTNGPSTGVELPRENVTPSLTPYERKEGVRRFDPNIGRSTGSSKSSVGQTRTVYYLEKEHSAEQVIREWASANPQVLDGASPRAFLQAINDVGPKFAEVSKEVTRDLYGEAAWKDAYSRPNDPVEKGQDSHDLKNALLDADPDEVSK